MTGMTEDHKKSEIVTHRLCLRQFRQEDLEAYARIMGDHEVGKWFPKGTGYTREEAKRSLDSILEARALVPIQQFIRTNDVQFFFLLFS